MLGGMETTNVTNDKNVENKETKIKRHFDRQTSEKKRLSVKEKKTI